MTKTCFKCHRELPVDEFYRHPMMADGRLGKCKPCTRRDVQENRAARREQYNAYDRERAKRPEKIASLRASRARYPERERARTAVHNAVARRKLQKQPCEVCGELKVEAHHEDYSQPLNVRWLCRTHHARAHRFEPA